MTLKASHALAVAIVSAILVGSMGSMASASTDSSGATMTSAHDNAATYFETRVDKKKKKKKKKKSHASSSGTTTSADGAND